MNKINLRSELTQDAEKRLQFVIMLSLFFPVLIEALYKFTGNSDVTTNKVILSWSLNVCFLIIMYIFFEIGKKYLYEITLKILNWLLLFFPIVFSVVVYLFVAYPDKPLTDSIRYLLSGSLFALWFLPLVMIFTISFDFLIKAIKYKS